ncbi:MAG TPA: hypothetical protein VEZ90_01155, partial [Blastocatellia bacterium]|nr:hypothetical protein [Blastocatellia bacterium]
ELVRQIQDAYTRDWADELGGATRAGILFLRTAASEAATSKRALQDPDYVNAVTNTVRTCAEVEITTRLVNARLKQMKAEQKRRSIEESIIDADIEERVPLTKMLPS